MNQNQKNILIELMSDDTVSGERLANQIQMSTRSVRTLIKQISSEIKGAQIISGSFGYKLDIYDMEELLKYMQQDEEDENARFKCIFNHFINDDDYIRIDQLCDELYLSRTQLKQELKKVRYYFDEYNVNINTKSYYGMYLDGSEMNKRRAIAHFENLEIDDELFQQIKNIFISCIANAEFVVSDDELNNLVLHLYVAYIRSNKKQYINMDNKWIEDLKKEKEYSLASTIMSLMKQILNMEYRIEEVAYLTMHLCGKNNKQSTNTYIDQEIYQFTHECLEVLDQQTGFSFSTDLNLQLALSLHMIPLIKRIQYKSYMTNPLLLDVKKNLIRAYDISVKLSELVNQKYNCQLPEDEIAYMALHINLSLEQNMNDMRKKNILLVCSSGVGSARMLEYFFKENFNKYIRQLDVCSLQELSNYDTNVYDCIFTTVPILEDLSLPIFQINNFMNAKDTTKITNSLKQLNQENILQYFPRSLFLSYESFNTKEEAIHEIVSQCHKYYELPDYFENLILERENLATTEFNDFIAFPHSHKPVSNDTFVSVTILKKPLLWKNHKIRIILLSSIENKANKKLDSFYKVVSILVSDQTLQWQLLQHPTYEYFCDIIQKVM
ncbi:MAG: BglG family transcription antiterminator [Erysipelotrichaceae bacterium]|nr:BglG family transcription antiterminator [Erysipelotrichaceae bacterium]